MQRQELDTTGWPCMVKQMRSSPSSDTAFVLEKKQGGSFLLHQRLHAENHFQVSQFSSSHLPTLSRHACGQLQLQHQKQALRPPARYSVIPACSKTTTHDTVFHLQITREKTNKQKKQKNKKPTEHSDAKGGCFA